MPERTRTARAPSVHLSREPTPSTRTGCSQHGPIYIFECGLCGKKFHRNSYDSSLNPHKNPDGWNCPGRTGLYVETRYE